MTVHPSVRIALASCALALAGAASGQAQTAPTTSPTAPPASATQPAATPAAAPATQPAASTGTTAPAPDKAKRRGGNAAGAAKSGGTAAGSAAANAAVQAAQPGGPATGRKQRSSEPREAPPPGRQLQTAYAELMTPEEMKAHRSKVKSVKTYADCKSLFDAAQKEMEPRSKAQNKPIKNTPDQLCDQARERGRVTG